MNERRVEFIIVDYYQKFLLLCGTCIYYIHGGPMCYTLRTATQSQLYRATYQHHAFNPQLKVLSMVKYLQLVQHSWCDLNQLEKKFDELQLLKEYYGDKLYGLTCTNSIINLYHATS